MLTLQIIRFVGAVLLQLVGFIRPVLLCLAGLCVAVLLVLRGVLLGLGMSFLELAGTVLVFGMALPV